MGNFVVFACSGLMHRRTTAARNQSAFFSSVLKYLRSGLRASAVGRPGLLAARPPRLPNVSGHC